MNKEQEEVVMAKRKDEWDELAESIVFEDTQFREHLEDSDDVKMCRRLAELMREREELRKE